MDVIQHAVQWCEQQGLPLTYVCCLYATAPFVQSKDLQKGWEIVQQPGVKYAFSATTFPFPIQRAIKLSNGGSVSMFSPEYELTRSQDLEESYHDAGQFYWGEVSAFKQGIGFFNKQSRIVELPRKRVQDIDTPEDWEFAEILFSMLDREKS